MLDFCLQNGLTIWLFGCGPNTTTLLQLYNIFLNNVILQHIVWNEQICMHTHHKCRTVSHKIFLYKSVGKRYNSGNERITSDSAHRCCKKRRPSLTISLQIHSLHLLLPVWFFQKTSSFFGSERSNNVLMNYTYALKILTMTPFSR